MKNFNYYNPAEIVFGVDSLNQLKPLLAKQNISSLLFVYSGSFIKDLGIWTAVKKVCEELEVEFHENDAVIPNPEVELVRDLIIQGRSNNIDFVLGAGGGSAIDTAKAIAVGIPYSGDVWDLFEYKAVPEVAIPVGAISTIPASGSEASNCSIISNGHSKVGIEYDCIIPKFAIMDPTFTLSLPAYQTSCGIADILSHMLERYFSNVAYTDTTDYLIEGAIQALLLNAQRLINNPKNLNARSEVQCLAFLAHNNLLDIGRTADWGSHRIEHELSAQYGITHGEGMAIVTVAWMKYIAFKKPEKLAQLANRIFHIDYYNHSKTEMAEMLADNFRKFFISLHLKTTLVEMDISSKYFEDMALRATNNGTQTIGHYFPLNKNQIIDILKLAIEI